MLDLNKKFTLLGFEENLSKVQNGEVDIKLPNSLKSSFIGGEAAMIQLIISWARAPRQGTLSLYANSDEDVALKNFATMPFGLVALNMARKIVGVNDAKISRRAAMELAVPFMKKMHDDNIEESSSANSLPLICIDNSKNYRMPSRLYNLSTQEVLTTSDFHALTKKISEVIIWKSRKKDFSDDVIKAVSVFFHEAFLNTQEHALASVEGDQFDRSVRGAIFQRRNVEISRLQEMAEGHTPLKKYFEAWRPDVEAARDAQFVEVSVFDSGPGLAQTWLKRHPNLNDGSLQKNISINEEYEAVLKCLRLHGTSKLNESRGMGLYRILGALKDRGGFLRLRSGRLALMKCFATEPGRSELTDDDLIMEDAFDGGDPYQDRAWAEGTLLTAMFPLNRGGQNEQSLLV